MKSDTIRQAYIDHFVKRGHHHVPHAPIVNRESPDLLFINAGMNPFISILMGNEKPTHRRIVNSQPCLRVTGKHNDLEEVGHDTYHHTLFEMLGNWSFGDYFKKEAITWIWELFTDIYKMDPARLYATIFEGDSKEKLTLDSAAAQEWRRYLPESHIIAASKRDNFWEMGKVGPCGPSSEVHIDLRSDEERKATPAQALVNRDHPQVLELGNIVFVQYHRQQNGTLVPLPEKHIDVGIGLERVAMALQGKQSTYDTDLFTPITDKVRALTGHKGKENEVILIALRVLADHIRAITFAIADGATPSPQKAGYIIRHLLRRASRYAHTHLNHKEPILYKLVPIVIDLYAKAYPHLVSQKETIAAIVKEEEETFNRTMESGLKRLQDAIAALPEGEKTLPGQVAFVIYDTYGFPLEIVQSVAREQGFNVDKKGFDKAMAKQKSQSKRATTHQHSDWVLCQQDAKGSSHFIGDPLPEAAQVRIVKYRTLTTAKGKSYQIILDRTPFYGEQGGQVGDIGALKNDQETLLITDTKREHGHIIHYCETAPRHHRQPYTATIDPQRRQRIAANHTATHLLANALQQVLQDPTIGQKGSHLDDKRLRFDFNYSKKITLEQRRAVQDFVNGKIRENLHRTIQENIPMIEAKKQGVTAHFDEKYGDYVRVVTFSKSPTGEESKPFSRELCGGTHVTQTGEIGYFYITELTTIATGIKRIVALTGEAAQRQHQAEQDTLQAVRDLLHQAPEPAKALEKHLENSKEKERLIHTLLNSHRQNLRHTLSSKWQKAPHGQALIEAITFPKPKDLRKFIERMLKDQPNAMVALATQQGKGLYLHVGVTPSLTSRIEANTLVRELVTQGKGKGGGTPTHATLVVDEGSDPAPILAYIQAQWDLCS